MKKVAIFPGSFDPFTIGHASIVERGLPLFDEIVIGVGLNESKRASPPSAGFTPTSPVYASRVTTT